MFKIKNRILFAQRDSAQTYEQRRWESALNEYQRVHLRLRLATRIDNKLHIEHSKSRIAELEKEYPQLTKHFSILDQPQS